jgi:hypothetical protein
MRAEGKLSAILEELQTIRKLLEDSRPQTKMPVEEQLERFKKRYTSEEWREWEKLFATAHGGSKDKPLALTPNQKVEMLRWASHRPIELVMQAMQNFYKRPNQVHWTFQLEMKKLEDEWKVRPANISPTPPKHYEVDDSVWQE